MKGCEFMGVLGFLEVFNLRDERLPENLQEKVIRVWLPESYDKNNRYPVIYMHDGQNLFDSYTSYAGEWEVDETIEDFIVSNPDFKGAIVVGIDNSSFDRISEYTYNLNFLKGEKLGKVYMDFIVDILKPYIDTNYSTKPERKYTSLAGSSMGGLIAFFGGLENLKTFGSLLCFSTSTQFIENYEYNLPIYLAGLDKRRLKSTNFYFYVGTDDDGDINWPSNFKTYLLNNNVPFEKICTEIGYGFYHNELAWKIHFKKALKWLYNLK